MSSPNAKVSYSTYSKMLIGIHRWVSHRHRVCRLIDELASRIPQGASVLDLGCGDMSLLAGLAAARRLTRCVGADIWAARVPPPAGCEYVQVAPCLPLPWRPAEFDVVLLVDTLHHADSPAELLAQALLLGRVVLVKDHLEYGFATRSLLRLMDYVGNYGYGVSVPRRYFTQPEFMALAARIAPDRRCQMDVGLDLYNHLPMLRNLLPPKLHFVAQFENGPRDQKAGANRPGDCP